MASSNRPELIPGWATYLLLALIGVVSFSLRFEVLGRYAGLPSADHGVYLAQVDILFGKDVQGFGPTLPPIFLLFLAAFRAIVDPIMAVRLAVTIPSAFLPFPFYFLVSRYASRPWSILTTALFVLNEGYSEMTGWGGGPDFIALGFMIGSLVFLLAYLDSPARPSIILACVFASLVVGTHYLTAYIFAATVATWGAFETLRMRSWKALIPFLKFAAGTGLLSLPYIPIYVPLIGNIASQITPLGPEVLANAGRSMLFLFRDSLTLWIPVAALAVAGIFLLLAKRREATLFLAFAAVDFAFAITTLRDNASRPLYYLYLPLLAGYPTFFTWLFTLSPPGLSPRDTSVVRALVVVFVVVSSGLMIGQSAQRMSLAVDWYHAIDTPELQALDWIARNTPPDAAVATVGVPFFDVPEGTRYAWWIEGYAQRRAFYTGTETFAALLPEREMIHSANLFFAGNFGVQTAGLRLAENGPAGLSNPAISADTGLGYRLTFFLNDGLNGATYSDASAPSVNRSWNALSSPEFNVSWAGSSSKDLAVVRSDGNVSLTRVEGIEDRSVKIRFDAVAANGTLHTIDIPVWVGWGYRFGAAAVRGTYLDGLLIDEAGRQVPFGLNATPEAGDVLTLEPTNSDPVFGLPVVHVVLVLPSGRSAASFTLELSFPQIALSESLTWDAFLIANSFRVGYVFQNKSLLDFVFRFSGDNQHFFPVFENERIMIFRVVPDGQA